MKDTFVGNLSTRKPPFRLSVSTLLWLALLGLASLTIALNASELKAIVHIAHGGRLSYLPALFVLEVVFVLNMGMFSASTFRATGLHSSIPRFTLISAASHFINLVSKSSGLGGMALYLKEGQRQGEPSGTVTAAYMAGYALGYAAFLAILLISLVMLYLRGSLTTFEIGAASILFVLVLGVSTVLLAGLSSEASLERLLLLCIAPFNSISSRILGKLVVPPGHVQNLASELFEAVQVMRSRPKRFVVPFGHAVAVELLSALGLFLVARSLNVPMGLETAVAAYALSLLFAILSITPAGLGFVEVSLVVFLVSTGITRQQAIAVTIGFRLFDFWLPIAVGAICAFALRTTERSQR